MSSTDTSTQPAKKRARRSMASTRAASASDILRAKKISNRLSFLLEEFPEVKFILDFENLQTITETAVVKYTEEKEAKKHETQFLLNYCCQDSTPLHSLPDEVLSNCLSFVGKGHYGSVGLVSKKINEVYKEDFGKETAYLEMATSINQASYCLNLLCKDMREKDEVIKAAAVNGNVDILREAVKDGYDLFPLIAMKKIEVHSVGDDEYRKRCDCDWDYDEDEMDEAAVDIYSRGTYEWGEPIVKLSKLVERNRLTVLKYLYEELNYRKGLQRYIKPAIEHSQLDILKWFDSIGFLDEDDPVNCIQEDYDDEGKFKGFYFCDCAVKSGNVEVLKWFRAKEYYFGGSRSSIMEYAICSNSLEMIKFCSKIGYDFNDMEKKYEIRKRKSVELYRLLNELGFRFEGGIRKWVSDGYKRSWNDIENCFDIIKFLRSIAVPWDDRIMKEIVEYGTLEMIQFAHEDGCPWTGEEISHILEFKHGLEKFKYLIETNFTIDYEHAFGLRYSLQRKKELKLLDYFVGKNSSFDNNLFEEFFVYDGSWFEGISYLLEKGKDVQNFKSLEEVFQKCKRMDGIKFFHSLGLPWCLDSSRNSQLLSEIACYNDLDDVKWAYANGCKGGQSFPYIEEEWEEDDGIRNYTMWKANSHFFEKIGILPHINLPNGRSCTSTYTRLRSDLVAIDNTKLKSLVEGGNISFNSEREKEAHVNKALEMCFEYAFGGHGENINNRKRLALFQQMRVV